MSNLTPFQRVTLRVGRYLASFAHRAATRRMGNEAKETRGLKYPGVPLRDPVLKELFGQDDNYSGMDVDADTAMNHSAVWSAVSLISSSLAMAPIQIRNIAESEKKGAPVYDTDCSVYTLLNVSPHPYMNAFTCRELMQRIASTWGNAYAEILRDGNGKPYQLDPFIPGVVKPKFDDDGALYYHVEDGTADGYDVLPENMFHLMGMTDNGYEGYSVIEHARQSIGLGLVTEKYGAMFFGEGATPRTIITHPGKISKKARLNISKSFKEKFNNNEAPHGVKVLDEGMQFTTIGLPPEDSQFLGTRQFSIAEIARWFRTPPHMLYDFTGAALNTTEQQGQQFATFTLMPWGVRWYQECKKKLFTPSDHSKYELEFNFQYLYRADLKSRYDAYNTGRNGGWLSLNDIMRAEGMPLLPPEIGDTHLRPSTMLVLEHAPTTAVSIETFNGTVEQLQRLGALMPLTKEMIRDVIDATMPGAPESFTKTLTKYLTESGHAK